MNKLSKFNHIESILEGIRDNGAYTQEEKDTRYDLVEQSVQAFVAYHNEAVSQGAQITMQRIRLGDDFDAFAKYVSNLHERRKEMHKAMIDHAGLLNQLCADEGLPAIYDGPYDADKGRDDPDTRFGVAAFGEELCRDLFKTTETLGIPAKAHEAFKDHAQRVSTEGKHWTAMQRMLEQSSARREMDANQYGV